MADPRAFISFDADHNENEKNLFTGQMKNSRVPFSIEDWSSKSVLPQKQWEDLINEKINKCNMLIVLVGQSTYYATGVLKEIKFAHAQNVPVFGVYVAGANSTTSLPDGLQRNRVINWDWEHIDSAVNQCMTEGKNK